MLYGLLGPAEWSNGPNVRFAVVVQMHWLEYGVQTWCSADHVGGTEGVRVKLNAGGIVGCCVAEGMMAGYE